MMKDLPNILPANELLEHCFSKIRKIAIVDKNPYYRKKKTIISKTDSFSNTVITKLEQFIKSFPSIEKLPSFYIEILDIKIGVDKLKKSLGAINWAKKTCQNVYKKQKTALIKSSNINFLLNKQKEIFGRISDIVKQVNNELLILSDAVKELKNLPQIQEIPTVVIAGYPNVGKSSILKCLSSAKPEIAQYPFTTKEIHIGHINIKQKYKIKRIQVIDTPGLLDRPINEKNIIEKQAIAALKHLADIILFVIDPSETCGYLLKDQLNLLKQIQNLFKLCPLIIVENKIDLKKNDSKYLKISCETKEGIELLKKEIITLVNKKKLKKQYHFVFIINFLWLSTLAPHQMIH